MLIPPGDADALADALLELLGDPRTARRLAERARHRARDFSWEAVVDRMEALYRSSVATSRVPETLGG